MAHGSARAEVEALGEIAELADTINAMIDTLATFADQVTTVAREQSLQARSVRGRVRRRKQHAVRRDAKQHGIALSRTRQRVRPSWRVASGCILRAWHGTRDP